MHSLRFLVLASCLGVLFACGGGSGAAAPDARVSALGQLCAVGAANTCPAEAPSCLVFSENATMGICSTSCLSGGTLVTDANGGIMSIIPDPTIAPHSTTCTSVFIDAVGTAGCDAIIDYAPLDNPALPNKTYTAVAMACAIECGVNNTCPGTLRCDPSRLWCVPP
jgi:hypothetical protein